MAYDVNEQELLNTISTSDLPGSAKSVIASLLGTGTGTKSVETLTGGGTVDPLANLAEITGSGVYNAAGTPVIIVNSNDAVQITYTVGGSTFVILAGSNDDIIVIQDGAVVGGAASDRSATGSIATGGTVDGGDGNDSITGASGNDTISGGAGNDSITGGAGNDVINLGSGSDSVSGGSGFDRANVEGGLSSYTVTVDASGNVVLTDGAGLVDTLNGVEFVTFTDGSILTALANEDQAVVTRLYETVLDRAADAEGLNFWLSNLEDGTINVQAIAQNLLASSEYLGKASASATNADFVASLYTQLLNRAADTAGQEFWVSVLDSGLSREAVAVGFAASQEAADAYNYIKIVGTNVDFDFS